MSEKIIVAIHRTEYRGDHSRDYIDCYLADPHAPISELLGLVSGTEWIEIPVQHGTKPESKP